MKQKSENIYFQPLILIDMRGGITQNSWITCVVSFCSSAVSHLLKRNKEKLNVTCVCVCVIPSSLQPGPIHGSKSCVCGQGTLRSSWAFSILCLIRFPFSQVEELQADHGDQLE